MLGGECRRGFAILTLIASVATADGVAFGQPCVGDCNGDGAVRVDELILAVNIALDTRDIAACPNLDNGNGMVTVERLIIAVNGALDGCGATSPTPTPSPGTTTPTIPTTTPMTPTTTPMTPTTTTTSGTTTPTTPTTTTTITPTATPGTTTPTQTPTAQSESMWVVDNYEVTSSDCAGVIEDSVVSGLEARGPDFTVRRSGDHVEIEDSEGDLFQGTADPDGTVHVQGGISDSILTCDYNVDVDASADLSQSPTTATHDAAVNFSGFCLGFSDCSLQLTSRWRRVNN